MKILHLDTNHKLLINQLNDLGFTNHEDYKSPKPEIEAKISEYDGIIIRSRFLIDKSFLDAAKNLKFIGRLGAGLENIDCDYAEKKGVVLFNLNDNIIAWEASCPNEKPSDCSTMEIKGLQAECKCNSNLYSLANGQPLKINTNNSFPMVAYFTEKSGNSLRIYN